jgi:hypothetical protein
LTLVAFAGFASAPAFAVSACTNGTTLFSIASAVVGTVYYPTSSTTPPGTPFACTAGPYNFSNFELDPDVPADSGDNIGLSINSVTVSGGVISLAFGTELGQGQDIQLSFSISPGIGQIVLFDGGSPNGSISEYICSSGVFVADGGNGVNCGSSTQYGSLSVGAGGTASAFVTSPEPIDYVFKDIGAGNEASSSVSEFGQTIVPEPMTLSLVGASLLGLGFLGRRRARK